MSWRCKPEIQQLKTFGVSEKVIDEDEDEGDSDGDDHGWQLIDNIKRPGDKTMSWHGKPDIDQFKQYKTWS